jgi:trimeric autotransporter adhesin
VPQAGGARHLACNLPNKLLPAFGAFLMSRMLLLLFGLGCTVDAAPTATTTSNAVNDGPALVPGDSTDPYPQYMLSTGSRQSRAVPSATALGYDNNAQGGNSLIVGYASLTSASASSAVVLGRFAQADGFSAFAAGDESLASGDFSVAIGRGATAYDNSSVTIRGIGGVRISSRGVGPQERGVYLAPGSTSWVGIGALTVTDSLRARIDSLEARLARLESKQGVRTILRGSTP